MAAAPSFAVHRRLLPVGDLRRRAWESAINDMILGSEPGPERIKMYSGALLLSTLPSEVMAVIGIRILDPDVKARLRVRAAEHGRSMEAETRAILVDAVAERPMGLFDAIRVDQPRARRRRP